VARTVWKQLPVTSHQPRVTPIRSDDAQDLLEQLGKNASGILVGLVFGVPLGWLLHLHGIWLYLFVVVAVVVIATSIKGMATAIVDGTANAFLRMVWPTGSSTPYTPAYSMEEAMVARGDVDGALAHYGAAMRLHPTDPDLRFRVGELLFRSTSPARAAMYFIEGRQLAGDNRGRELYATQRLIDLYLGSLGNPVGALVELTRLVDRFPGTREAESAANMIARLKQPPVES
jgi:hypothetical protein